MTGESCEPLSTAPRARGCRQAGARRPDRRRQVRLDVPLAGAAHARACTSSRLPTCRADARTRLARAAWAGRRSSYAARRSTRRATRRHDLRDRRRRWRDRASRGRGRHRRDRQPRRRHRATCSRAATPRQARRDGERRGRRARRAAAGAPRAPRRASSIRSPTATSPRSSASWSTGRAPRASTWSPPARARSTCRRTTRRRPRRCGATTASTPRRSRSGDFNAQMFNSFLDGTKAASRWRRWRTRPASRRRPTGSRSRRAASTTCRACCGRARDGGQLDHAGQVEVISSLERDGRPVFRDLRWGVYVTFAAEHEYVRRCFHEYGIVTDAERRVRGDVQAVAT